MVNTVDKKRQIRVAITVVITGLFRVVNTVRGRPFNS